MADQFKRSATYANLEAVPDHLVAEIIDGELMTRAHGLMRTAAARTALATRLRPATGTRSNPGVDWQIVPLPELHLGSDVAVPDVGGWRGSRLPYLPDEHVTSAPDWVCELISADPATNPAITAKLRLYAMAGVEHAWIVDLTGRRLHLLEASDGAWKCTAAFEGGTEVSAPPFDAISFSLADLWPLDKPLGFNEDPQALYAGDR